MCGSACSSEGLEQRPRRESVWEGSGPGSASLACPRTLARCVELWGIRADVWVWLFWNDPGKRQKSSFLSHFGPGALGRSGELCGV